MRTIWKFLSGRVAWARRSLPVFLLAQQQGLMKSNEWQPWWQHLSDNPDSLTEPGRWMTGPQIVQARVKRSIHVRNHPQCPFVLFPTHRLYTIFRSLHSRKLHILGFRARMVCTNSLVIFFFSLSDNGTYHFWSRSLPWRLNSSMNCICNDTGHKRGSQSNMSGDCVNCYWFTCIDFPPHLLLMYACVWNWM